MNQVIVFTDGGSRGNPGPAAIGVVADLGKLSLNLRGRKQIQYRWSQSIGRATNNEAEYQAIIFALKKLKALFGRSASEKIKLLFKTDSQLVARQLQGKYKLKERELFAYFIEIWNLKQEFKQVEFQLIPRQQNQLADQLVNLALDKELSQLRLP